MSSSHGGESGRWMVSYADFLTLLFVLFVILYSMGQTDLAKYKRLAQSFQAAFSGGGGANTAVIDPLINQTSGGGNSTSGEVAPIVVEGLPRQSSVGSEVAGELSSLLEDANLSKDVSVQNNVEGALISLSEKLEFVAGTTELNPDAYPVLDSIAAMILPMDNNIKIVGHTDDTPPTDSRYTDNWMLSVGRANIIVQYFISKGIDPGRLIISGRGEYEKVAPNDSAEHRALNNRADIVVIYPQDVEDVINLDVSQPTSVGP